MAPPFNSTFDPRARPTVTVTAAALVAFLMLRRLQRSSGRLALLTSTRQIAICRIKRSYFIPAITSLAIESVWQEDQNPDLPINAIGLAPDAASLAVFSSEINQGQEVDQFGRIYDLDTSKLAFTTGSDDTFRGKYLPDVVRSDDADVPPWLAEHQDDYAKLWALSEMPLPVPVLTAVEGKDFLRSGIDDVYWTPAGDFVVSAHVYLVLDVDDGNLVTETDDDEQGDLHDEHHAASRVDFWVRFQRDDGIWSWKDQSFNAPWPKYANLAAAVPLALGADLPAGGRQLLLSGKPLKLPATLAGGVIAFSGPWTD